MAGHIATAARQDWCTPRWIIALVRLVFGSIDLDPCSNEQSLVAATKAWSLRWGQDGLVGTWGKRNVYVNPPYGRGLVEWVQKAVIESQHGAKVVMLIPAAVGTRFWHKYVWAYAGAICFLRGRVKFEGAKTGAPMDSAVIYFGDKAGVDRFDWVFKDVGRVVRL